MPLSLHLVFTGNPGTGKTTVARLVARIYHSLGLLPKGHLIEAQRSDLVGAYVGNSEEKTTAVINNALGGVLFIDEAYSLNQGDKNDYGAEVIATLISAMENRRDNLAVIVAGYPDKMKEFIASNPGLRSRFNTFISFDDYSPEEMICILEGMLGEYEYWLEADAQELAKEYFQNLYKMRDESFGNGRDVRNFANSVIKEQENRLASIKRIQGTDAFCTIKMNDVAAAIKQRLQQT